MEKQVLRQNYLGDTLYFYEKREKRRLNKGLRGGLLAQQVRINNPEDLEKWLEDKPKSWAQAIVVRAALRVIPVLIHVYREETFDEELLDHLTISIFRACFISDVAVVGLSSEIKQVVVHAAGNAARVAAHVAVLAEYVRDAANAARAAAYAAYAADATNAAVLAGSGVQAADHAAEFAANVGVSARAAYVADTQWLEGQEDRRDAAFLLASQPLWLNVGSSFGYEWRELVKNLLADDHNWKFWIDWYQAKRDGTLHIGLRGGARERLYSHIALFSNELWEEGAEVVNGKIAGLLEEIKGEESGGALSDKEEEIVKPRTGPQFGEEKVATELRSESVKIDARSPEFRTRIELNKVPIKLTCASLLLQIDDYKEKIRRSNSLFAEDPDAKDDLLATLANISEAMEGIGDSVGEDGVPLSDEELEVAATWFAKFHEAVSGELEKYVAPDNVAKAVVPTGIVLGCGTLGSLLGGVMAVGVGSIAGFGVGSYVGRLLTNNLKPRDVVNKIEDSFDDPKN